ncbi:MAG: ComF family protein [Bacteroidales bacterium]|nr:ComF family protein [Bacteroidales bacterium]
MSFLRDFIELFFPRVCCICGNPLVGTEKQICTHCLLNLPESLSAKGDSNIVEKRLMGRIPIVASTALLVFSENSMAQKILHQIKYYGNTELAVSMGRQLGMRLAESDRFDSVDIIVPVPLHRKKLRKRGYNQSFLICQGIAQTFPRPINRDNLIRTKHTETQTRKNREERIENMHNVFHLLDESVFENKHVLLVDDVITTGSTTEACWNAMKETKGIKISVISLAITGEY